MLIDVRNLSAEALYHLMIQIIVPRPIAWVLSDNGDKTYNLAPFSFFNGITSEPPLIMIAVGRKESGEQKDTWFNIAARSVFVAHIPSVFQADSVVASSAALAHGDSEVLKGALTLQAVEGWELPRLKGPAAALLCQKYSIFEVGTAPEGLILGQIKKIWIDEAVIEEDGQRFFVDPQKLNPLVRLGGSDYASLGKSFTIRSVE